MILLSCCATIEELYSKSVSAVGLEGELTEWFKLTSGVQQECGLSSDFNLLLEDMMKAM